MIVREIGERFGLADDVEITTEANPETVTPAYLDRLRAAGFTRISLGMQSAVPRVLAVLDRQHRPGRPEQAVAEARAAGFEHVNLDLIYGAPYETDADWQASLDAAIGAGPDHVSAYALVVEQGTALARQVARGVVPAPDDDVLADRYVMADEALRAAGYEWYEISNWARDDGGRCRHNELYWTDANWWGFGPGRAQPRRRRALVERQAPGALRRAGRRRPQPGRRPRDARRRGPAHRAGDARRAPPRGARVRRLPEPSRGVLPQLASWGLVDQVDCRRRPGRAHPARPADGRRRGQGTAARVGLSYGPGWNASRSRMRTCSVVRPCSAARSARCRPSSR